jgi:hypothetical protein
MEGWVLVWGYLDANPKVVVYRATWGVSPLPKRKEMEELLGLPHGLLLSHPKVFILGCDVEKTKWHQMFLSFV